MMKLILLGSLMCLLFSFKKEQSTKPLKYIAFGDSYTICTGTLNDQEHWPNILTTHLNEAGIKIELIANPSRNGFTTQNVIDKELPLLNSTIDFATLLVGVNDWVRETDKSTYQKNLIFCIESILITIPDFGVTPQGAIYSNGRDISKGITEFNYIIKAEAKKRQLLCVDIFQTSQLMKNNKDLTALDGLHPSAKEYAVWETLIFPEAKKLLSK